jgi:4-amino-4-deoxy-L-arabinose transferase-like glycosyltransferase
MPETRDPDAPPPADRAARRRRIGLVAAILLLALGLRLAGNVVVARQTARAHGPDALFLFPDSRNFDAYARNLLHHGEYVDGRNIRAWRTPVYSMLLAGLYGTAGRSAPAARLLGNVLDVGNVLLVILLARRFFSWRAALWAGLFAALYPFFIYFSNLVLADTPSLTAVLLATHAVARLLGYRLGDGGAPTAAPLRGGWALLAGGVLALAVLVKPNLAFLPAAYAALLLAAAWRRRGALRRALRPWFTATALLALGFCLGMSPWWIRNAAVFDTVVPFSTCGGYALYESNSTFADGGPNHGKIVFPDEWHALMRHIVGLRGRDAPPGTLSAPEAELAADRVLREASIRWMRENPRAFLALAPVKVARTWNVVPNWAGARSTLERAASLLSYVPVMLLMLWGLLRNRRRWEAVALLLLPAIYFTALQTVFMGSVRYRLPAMGCLIVLAGAGMASLVERSLRGWRRPGEAPAPDTGGEA